MSYAGLAARAAKLAKALLRLGIKPGERVATLAWNTHRHMELYFAVSGIGAVLHTINPRLFRRRSSTSSMTPRIGSSFRYPLR
jgi:acyl-CoA synthetase (AMP-forming)/AMP-acid ligase II